MCLCKCVHVDVRVHACCACVRMCLYVRVHSILRVLVCVDTFELCLLPPFPPWAVQIALLPSLIVAPCRLYRRL